MRSFLPTLKSNPAAWLPIGILILCFHLVLSAQVPDFHFEDPGIGWHLKSGELMLEQGGLL
ncbi:MAG: hypothetical protein AAF571_15765, partial [Verrucomicrobiota bacterium]